MKKIVDNYDVYLTSYWTKRNRVVAKGYTVSVAPMSHEEYEMAIKNMRNSLRAQGIKHIEGSSKLAQKLASNDVYNYKASTIKLWQGILGKDKIKINIHARMKGLPEPLRNEIKHYKKEHPDWVPHDISVIFFGSK